MSVSGDSTLAPTCSIQRCTPCPTPSTSRPGNSRSIVAISIAASATLRNGIGSTPMPRRMRLLQASAAVAVASPDSRKQSSHEPDLVDPGCLGGFDGGAQPLGREGGLEDDADRHGLILSGTPRELPLRRRLTRLPSRSP